MKKTIKTIAILALVLGSTKAIAQNAAINSSGAAPDASAMLDVSSTTKGLLTPRMTSAQRTAIGSPATGLVVYQTDGTAGFYYYNGSAWVMLVNAGSTPTFLTKTADYTITSADAINDLVLVHNRAGTNTFTLPTASSVSAGKKIYISTSAFAQYINVLCSGADTFSGGLIPVGSTSTYTGLGNSYLMLCTLMSNGVDKWYLVDLMY